MRIGREAAGLSEEATSRGLQKATETRRQAACRLLCVKGQVRVRRTSWGLTEGSCCQGRVACLGPGWDAPEAGNPSPRGGHRRRGNHTPPTRD
jgi:hypothetical protein